LRSFAANLSAFSEKQFRFFFCAFCAFFAALPVFHLMAKIPLHDGRRLFGNDSRVYAAARPDYPDALYQRLVTRCGLGAGRSVFEVGPGTGLATRRLLSLGASPLRAIEPDARLAAFLRDNVGAGSLEIDQTSFEDALLPSACFDLGVSATAFHWLDQGSALAKVYRTLKPGGWWAMWWNHFGSDEPDAFQQATDHLFAAMADSPSWNGQKGIPFALDRESRIRDLTTNGFEDAEVELWRWSVMYDTPRLLALYSTFSPVQSLAPESRQQFLSSLGQIADHQFGGRVERRFMTALYTARRG
jgi:SAM-dependent methyltransferase